MNALLERCLAPFRHWHFGARFPFATVENQILLSVDISHVPGARESLNAAFRVVTGDDGASSALLFLNHGQLIRSELSREDINVNLASNNYGRGK